MFSTIEPEPVFSLKDVNPNVPLTNRKIVVSIDLSSFLNLNVEIALRT